MRLAYPRSLLKLLLLGFALAILPLLFAFANASRQVDLLAEQSRLTLERATQATRASHVLLEQIRLMERSARQYFVFQDAALLNNYRYAHDKFLVSLNTLKRLDVHQQQLIAIQQIQTHELNLFNKITAAQASSVADETTLKEMVTLSIQGEAILNENNQMIDQASANLEAKAAHTQKVMLWQTLTLIPVALVIALIIAYLVARPIRRMDQAIRRLGEGQYEQSIQIDGPGDIKTLGERLDWLRQQLSELDMQKQRFLRHVSHELKTPLTVIREGSELLHDQVGGQLKPQQLEIVAIVRENSVRLQKMIENLLHYTAAQHQTLKLNLSQVNILEVIEEVMSQYSLAIENKQLNIIRNFSGSETSVITADREKVNTIIDNLISNAVKYTTEGGQIAIKLASDEQSVFIDVQDDGIGISAKDKAHLFAPFYRGQQEQENLVGGTGLGLSITREYVEAHGGDIQLLASIEGACFRVRLPIQGVLQENHAHENI